MIKKILLALGCVFALLIVGFVALLFWAQHAGSQQQERFFKTVAKGDPDALLALCDPALREQIDAPVLATWMAEVNKQLGEFQGLSKADFSTEANTTDKGTFVHSEGTVNFQKGEAKSDLEFLDDLLVKFSVNSDKIPKDWFTGPTDTTLYKERGEKLIRKLLESNAKESAEMMHESLRANLPDDKLNAMMEELTVKAGPLKSIECLDAKFTTDEKQTLTVSYRLDCEKGALDSTVDFDFAGLKGHLTGFNFKDAGPNDSGN